MFHCPCHACLLFASSSAATMDTRQQSIRRITHTHTHTHTHRPSVPGQPLGMTGLGRIRNGNRSRRTLRILPERKVECELLPRESRVGFASTGPTPRPMQKARERLTSKRGRLMKLLLLMVCSFASRSLLVFIGSAPQSLRINYS